MQNDKLRELTYFPQKKELNFKWYRFNSDWFDVGVFDFGCCGYLLQVKVNRFNGKTFRVKSFAGKLQCARPQISILTNDKEER